MPDRKLLTQQSRPLLSAQGDQGIALRKLRLQLRIRKRTEHVRKLSRETAELFLSGEDHLQCTVLHAQYVGEL